MVMNRTSVTVGLSAALLHMSHGVEARNIFSLVDKKLLSTNE